MMKSKLSLVLLFGGILLINSCSAQHDYRKEMIAHRTEITRSYSDTSVSPLTSEDIASFTGLNYFEINENYKVSATVELTPEAEVFTMKTKTERRPEYVKYAISTFNLNGKELNLSLYRSTRERSQGEAEEDDYLFVPFTDLTSGEACYGGGRYLDIPIPKGKTITLDFNKAYNPYCAYNDAYSCPIPPAENFINTKVEAGEKKLHDH